MTISRDPQPRPRSRVASGRIAVSCPCTMRLGRAATCNAGAYFPAAGRCDRPEVYVKNFA